MTIKKIVAMASVLTVFGGLVLAVPAMAQTGNSMMGGRANWQGQSGSRNGMMRSGVFGTVTSVSGNTITITGQQGFGSSSPQTSFTVNAANAVVMKNNATSTIASVAIGDKIFAQGTVSGTNVTATMIRDGVMMGMRGNGKGPNGAGAPGQNKNGDWSGASTTSAILGNGQPVVAGAVSIINGNQLTVTTKSNVTYSVDATNAKFVSGNNSTLALSNVSVGDTVLIQGSINGTNVAASTVIDQSKPAMNSGNPNPGNNSSAKKGFFGGIGSFFMHLFGF